MDTLGILEGATVYGHKTGKCKGDAIRQIMAKLECIPCMSDDCDGIEDGEPATKDRPAPTRCHRCEAVRLAKSVVSG